MQTTFVNGLSVAFKGNNATPGMPAYVANGGIRTLGGIIDDTNTNVAYFGTALFADPDAPSKFFVGPTADATLFRGILLNRPMVNQQMPAHADYVIPGTPADAIYQGAVYVKVAGTLAVGASVYATSTGTLTVTSTGNTAINGIIKEIDTDTGLALVYFDGQF